MMIDQITLVNVLSFLIWKISIVYDMAQRPPGTEKIKTFSKHMKLYKSYVKLCKKLYETI